VADVQQEAANTSNGMVTKHALESWLRCKQVALNNAVPNAPNCSTTILHCSICNYRCSALAAERLFSPI
jgi:hypothetical protein